MDIKVTQIRPENLASVTLNLYVLRGINFLLKKVADLGFYKRK